MTRRMQALVIVRVRCLCRFRTPPNQMPYATRSDAVRCPIRFRTGDDDSGSRLIETIKGQFNIAIELPLHILL